MSCADSVLLVSSSNLIHDLWCRALGHKIAPENELKASRMPWITGLPSREIRVGRTASPTSPGMRVAAIRPTETTLTA